ncbi:MAG: glycosyltransferase family 1 protein [Flavobacteriales bacterium]|nr:glycosyltransferase family 1 protein [Flavobacteriales bacterium]
MKIGLDAKRIFHNHSGLGNYGRSTLQILAKDQSDTDFLLYTPKLKSHDEVAFVETQKNVFTKTPSSLFHKVFKFLWRPYFVLKQAQKDQIDLYHGLSNELPFGLKWRSMKKIVTIHDLIFLRYPKQYKLLDRMVYDFKSKYACKHADKVIAISEQTKRDLVEFYGVNPDKIEVIYQTCHPIFKEKASANFLSQIRIKYQLPDEFLLYVGSINERKNLMTLLESLCELPEEKLVVVGRGKAYKEKCMTFIQENNLSNRVFLLDVSENEDLAAIYQLADIMIYPSVFEGFGIPIIEALYSKTPVITSKGSCFAEAGGSHTLYINPTESSELKEAVLKIKKNPKLRLEMLEQGYAHAQKFSESYIAKTIASLYKRTLNDSSNSHHTHL